MKVILVKDMQNLGDAGSVVNVANGYGRNYLLPKGIAIMANDYNLAKVEDIKKVAETERLEINNKFKALAAKVEGVELSFVRKADENDHLFGSVSEKDIADALNEKGIEISKAVIKMEKHLKEIGDFEVSVVFTSDITATVKVNVDKEQ